MAIPFREGVPVDIIDGELAMSCPRLMPVLSRVDNAHSVGRVQTTLQICNRIGNLLATRGAGASTDSIADLASIE